MTASSRTRIAPSPTGMDLHIGNAYTALINYVVAKKSGGEFIIRIEDTDRTRLIEGSEGRILASLEWLGIPHQEGPDIGGPYAPYRQSDRLSTYRTFAEDLRRQRIVIQIVISLFFLPLHLGAKLGKPPLVCGLNIQFIGKYSVIARILKLPC